MAFLTACYSYMLAFGDLCVKDSHVPLDINVIQSLRLSNILYQDGESHCHVFPLPCNCSLTVTFFLHLLAWVLNLLTSLAQNKSIIFISRVFSGALSKSLGKTGGYLETSITLTTIGKLR